MQPEPGPVLLVGAGPGPADLMTVRALRAVESAQALLYDALVHEEVLALAPRSCLRIQTGKRAGKASMAQETINRLMLRLARRGLRVVRLKGGDPSIFGRCGEERAFLEANGVDVEVVPGVTAASAAAAQFAFPLTHRGEARQLVLATGRLQDGEGREDLAAFAREDTTLALYMGRDAIAAAAAQLIAAGRSPQTPAAAIENAGAPHARLIGSTLEGLGQAVAEAACSGPVIIVIGEVAAKAQAAAVIPECPSALPARRLL
jgi:uroporphyrin-III C-methyltransferase